MPPNGPNGQVQLGSVPITDANEVRDIEAEGSENTVGGDSALRSLLSKQYEAAQSAIRYFSLDWDEFEDLLMVQGRTPDNTRVRVAEGSLSSIVIERAGRVMANLPSGSVHALGLQNMGKGMLMQLTLDKYIVPNADYQYDMETKLWMWDMYSNVYGVQPMMYDWEDNENYTGPTCWMPHIRNFFPQQGRLSVRNCDYVYVSNFVSREEFQKWVDDDIDDYDLDAVQQVLNETAHGATMPKARMDYLRNNPMWEWRRRAPFTDTGEIEVVTKFERGPEGRWIDFCPDFANRVIRNIPNPHKNGRIPVVLKYGIPTLDSIVGRGDMEAGRYQQYAVDTMMNLMIDAMKLRTYPPIKVVNGNVIMPTIRFQPGAKWLVTGPNDVSHHQFPDIQDNMNLTMQMLKGALNNTLGNSQSQSSTESAIAPQQGKTPAAIKNQQMSESTRDLIDQRMMSQSIQELYGGMINLVASVDHDNPIEFYMFDKEIQQIAANYPDIKDAISFPSKSTGADISEQKAIKVTLKPSRLKNEKGYLYKINPGSTAKQDQQQTHQQLLEIWTEYLPNMPVVDAKLQQEQKQMDFAELFTRVLETGGLRDAQSLIKPIVMTGNQGAQPPGQGQQGPQESLTEQINIKDLPPAGQVQLAQQAGIQTTPQDWTGQQQQEAALKTQSQVAVKKTPAAPTPQPAAPAPASMGDPAIAHARAQINAKHNEVAMALQKQLAEGQNAR